MRYDKMQGFKQNMLHTKKSLGHSRKNMERSVKNIQYFLYFNYTLPY